MSNVYEYNPETDMLTIIRTTYHDGGRIIDESVSEYRLTDVDIPTLFDAMNQFDPDMLEHMDDDDSLLDWRICFRSIFMTLENACAASEKDRAQGVV